MKVPPLSRLASTRRKAYRALKLERLWSELRWPFLLVALWGGASLFHIPQSLPDSLHTLLEGGIIVTILWKLRCRIQKLKPISSYAIDRRIERDSNLPFKLLATLTDRAASIENPDTSDHHKLIWAQHQSRILTSAHQLRIKFPRFFPNGYSKVVTVCVCLFLALAFYLSSPHSLSRIRAGLLPGTDDDSIALPHFNAWIDSPTYAPTAPLFLSQNSQPTSSSFAEGASIHIIVSDTSSSPSLRGSHSYHVQRLSSRSWQIDSSLHNSDPLSLYVRGRTLARWNVTITPDLNPQIKWTKKPKLQKDNRQTLFSWEGAQNHGISSLEVILSPSKNSKKTTKPYSINIPLPLKGTPKHTKDQTTIDLSDNPLAGLTVQGKLHARSISGLENTSSTISFTLGFQKFNDPLARALISLRQRVALGFESIPNVGRDLSLLTNLNLPSDIHIPLAVIQASVQRKTNLFSLQEKLWFLALYAEDRSQSGLVMAESMAKLRSVQQDVQHQINIMGASHPPTLEQQKTLRDNLDHVENALNKHMNLMVQKASQSGIVMPLPNGKKAPWVKLAKEIEKNTQHNEMLLASRHLRQMVNMAEEIRQADVADMQSLSQQMSARDEALKQKNALRDFIKQETKILNKTQSRLATLHQLVSSSHENTDVSQMSTSDLLKQLGMNPPPDNSSLLEDDSQFDNQTRQKRSSERQNNYAVQYALQILDRILKQRSKDLTHKDNKGLIAADKDITSVLHALAQRHDTEASLAEQKVLEDLTQARKEMTENQKDSQKNQQGRLGFMPPPQSNQKQNQENNNGEGHHQEMSPMNQDEDQDQDLDNDSDETSQDDDHEKNDQSSQKNEDPLGRKKSNTPETDAHIPDHDHNKARAIEKELQRRASDQTRPQDELDYLNHLLSSFRNE